MGQGLRKLREEAGHCPECCPGDRSGDRTISGHDLCLSYPTPVSCPAPALTQNLLLARVNARFALVKWGPPAVSRHIIIHHILIVQTTNLAFNDVDNERSRVDHMQQLAYEVLFQAVWITPTLHDIAASARSNMICPTFQAQIIPGPDHSRPRLETNYYPWGTCTQN